MLTNIRCNDRLVKLAVHFLDDVHRAHMSAVFHLQRMLLFPRPDLLRPFRGLTGLHILVHFSQRIQRIRHDRHMDLYISGNRRRIYINMYDLRVWRKCMELSGDAVIKSGPDGEQEVALAHCHIGRVLAVHTQVADVERVIRRNRAAAHDRSHHRHICLIHHFRKHLVHAAACQEQRFLRLLQHLEGTFELSHVDACIRLIAADVHGFRIFRTAQFAHHIFGQVNEHRSRPSRPGDVECLFNNPPQIRAVPHCHTVLCDAAGDADDIHFLEGVISDQVSRHLACKTHKGHTVIIRRRQTRNQVRRPRSAGHQTHAHFAGRPRIGVRLVDQRLLVARQDDLNVVLTSQLIADINSTRARIPEDRIHSLFL